MIPLRETVIMFNSSLPPCDLTGDSIEPIFIDDDEENGASANDNAIIPPVLFLKKQFISKQCLSILCLFTNCSKL